MASFVTLSNGQRMPLLGLGCWQAEDGRDIAAAVKAALLAGYRHIDTAYLYQNEDEVGKGIKAAIDTGKVSRGDIFVVTKLPHIGMQPKRVEKYLRLSLKKLGLDYVDLYLIHHPVGFQEIDENTIIPKKDGKILFDYSTDLIAVWKEMERVQQIGLTKTIGVSNFNERQVLKIMSIAKVPPTVNQIECHVYFQQLKLRAACKKHNIAITAYAPLGSPGRKVVNEKQGIVAELPDLLNNPTASLVAQKHGKSPAQVLLRFLAQQKVVVIPKSTNEKRIRENGDIFSFSLDDVDMAALKSLNQGPVARSFQMTEFFPGYDTHPEYCF